jgi:hypothetical protein
MLDQFEVTLPLPPERLHPNKRLTNVYGVSKLVANTRATARLLTRQALPSGWQATGAVEIEATFWMPRRRDDDSLVSWMKSTRDGVADGLGGSDARFKVTEPTQVTGKAAGGQRKLVLVVRACQ